MESLGQFSIKWEIQLLVLLSFTLQMFLFFAGNLRRRSTSMLLRLSLWMTYLGADLVAIYALGFLSRHKDSTTGGDALRATHPLAFLWAPFLLVHLGGQDTITAFAMEDNNLWLRHLLNLVVQVVLALYVLWNSVGKRNVQLLVPGIFIFVAGIIKYGERIWALKCGSSKSLGESSGGDTGLETQRTGGYSELIRTAQRALELVRGVFGERRVHFLSPQQIEGNRCAVEYIETTDQLQLPKLLDVELGMMYDDLYTKATVLRRKSGIILRCISQISAMAALVVFLVSNKQRYSREDVAITYVLFAGSFFLEACAMFMFMKSPWTWARLKARKWHWLAGMSWRLLSSKIGWPEEGLLWSGYMGQLDINMEWWQLAPSSDEQARLSCKQRVMVWIRNLVGGKKGRLVWISKLIGTKYIEVDYSIMLRFLGEFSLIVEEAKGEANAPRQWQNLGPSLEAIVSLISTASLAECIGVLQVATESHLRKYSFPSADESVREMVDMCHKVSRYMAYLLVAHPSTVPGGGRAEDVLAVHFERGPRPDERGPRPDDVLAALPEDIFNTVRQEVSHANQRISNLSQRLQRFQNILKLPPSNEALEELVAMWIRLLIYVAAKSSPHMHAEQLGRGGELLTHIGVGDDGLQRIELTNASRDIAGNIVVPGGIYAFYLCEGSQPQNSETSVGAPPDQNV